MRVVVVGASGNVGTALLRRLVDDGSITSVVGVARRVPRSTPPAPYDVATWVACDVAAPSAVDTLTTAFAGADAVVHLAWAIQPSHDRRRLHDVNVAGTRWVLDAARRAGVPHVVVASSIGAYAPAPDDVPRGEGWATAGVRSSSYSVDKVAVERVLDEIEEAHPELTIARIRPALVFQRAAGHEISRYFLGPWVPKRALAGHLPVLPWPEGLRLQVVHAQDVAEAFREAVVRRVRGPFNLAAHEVLRGQDFADILANGRMRTVPVAQARAAVAVGWHARVVPVGPGWLDMALSAPLLDTSRAERELGWRPAWSGIEAARDLIAGIAAGAGTASPPMRPRHRDPGILDA
ncbi:NAD-dependent epimerase/dehydratase family protein [Cellulomonas fengjieae]|uniref:NAD-dependent epimerase/dehydratase family protein n=1 Tax=Cellulomonas fengjieae TaxID=2819978 RepID=A0ABS3SDD8_9CELL|nr:NAD-dependent epimerase/dehydratase family protein [Cellulomonas fengjieae]MBO3083772.1 NAD-dependent epimerase/dehydratase family protein [Cellulomonas fengjieae]QVI64935.1 NAD-dependent epimerase/dehydratase family protein [Cellulomonas fengjieae]